jgi:predicted ribosomally synthesized peptide with SipW-like signal peptide
MIRAILAGGLVLGVGAAVTLAAWNDSEFASGTFSAGTFDMQGSTDGTTFAQHASAGVGTAAVMSFTVNAATLSPTDVAYGAFAVRLAAGTTNDGNVVLPAPTTTGTVTNLTYEAVRTTSMTCNSGTIDSTGTSLITAGTAVTAVAGPAAFTLTKGATLAVPGAIQYICFKVTAGAGLTQGQSGTVTWQFTATSV